jgi:hypothetical protein
LRALQLGATFVASSFSGDKAQLVPLIEAVITHQGAAFINVISSCSGFRSSLSVTHLPPPSGLAMQRLLASALSLISLYPANYVRLQLSIM